MICFDKINEITYRNPGEVLILDLIDENLIDINPDYQRGLDDARV